MRIFEYLQAYMKCWFQLISVHNQMMKPKPQVNIDNLCSVLKNINSVFGKLDLVSENGSTHFPRYLEMFHG